MRENKKKHLEAKGWKVGNASEFLGLSPDEEASIAQRLQQAEELEKYRIRHRIASA